jgi:hypothetical protein
MQKINFTTCENKLQQRREGLLATFVNEKKEKIKRVVHNENSKKKLMRHSLIQGVARECSA